VIGLAGPFGSGCSTAAGILADRHGFKVVKLSDAVRSEWERRHPDREPTRTDLQSLGNQMRKEASNPGLLAERAMEAWEPIDERANIAVDGIRNLGALHPHAGSQVWPALACERNSLGLEFSNEPGGQHGLGRHLGLRESSFQHLEP